MCVGMNPAGSTMNLEWALVEDLGKAGAHMDFGRRWQSIDKRHLWPRRGKIEHRGGTHRWAGVAHGFAIPSLSGRNFRGILVGVVVLFG